MSAISSRTTSTSNLRLPRASSSNDITTPHGSPPASRRSNQTNTDKATAAFVRRTLCAHQIQSPGEQGRSTPKPVEDLLPPLTSSNDVDLELYAFIAIIIKDYVSVWYSKITPDHAFTDEVVQVIAHCTRQLEQRLRNIDFEEVLFHELPTILDQHVLAYRTALEASKRHPLSADLHQAYHALQPHPALAPVPAVSDKPSDEQQENEANWRQLLVQGILAVLLPTEDLENPCLRSLVAEIFAELILGNAVCGRACEPWMLWESSIRICETLRPREGTSARSGHDGSTRDGPSRLEQFGLLSSREEILKPVESRGHANKSTRSVSGLFWAVVQYTFLALTAMRALIVMLVSASSLPPRILSSNAQTSGSDAKASPHRDGPADSNTQPTGERPLLSMGLWSCLSHLIEVEQRMPWLAGFLSFMHWGSVYGIGKVGDTDSALDRILADFIRRRVLGAVALPDLLRSVRIAIFPNNALGPARAIPNAEQALDIKRRAAEALIGAFPRSFCSVYFASSDQEDWLVAVAGWLDVVGDVYLNKHLVLSIVELLVVRVMPELAEQGAEALLQDRLEGL